MTDEQFSELRALLIAQTAIMQGIMQALRALAKDSETAVDWNATLGVMNQAQTIHTQKGVRKK